MPEGARLVFGECEREPIPSPTNTDLLGLSFGTFLISFADILDFFGDVDETVTEDSEKIELAEEFRFTKRERSEPKAVVNEIESSPDLKNDVFAALISDDDSTVEIVAAPPEKFVKDVDVR